MLKVVKTKKLKQKKIIIISLILIFIFTILLLYSMKIFEQFNIKLEMAVCETIFDDISAGAIIIRDEIPVENTFEGFLKINVKDGEKIQKNANLASVYDQKKYIEDNKNFDKITEEILFLKKAQTGKSDFLQGFSWINNQIDDEINKVKLELREDNFYYSKKARKNIITYICKKLEYLGKTDAITFRIKELENEKNKIIKGSPKFILNAPTSGYFTHFTDGFEEKIDYKKILKNDVKNIKFNFDIQNLKQNDRSNTFGKIIKSDTWFMIFEVPNDEANKLKLDMAITVTLSNNYEKIICKVVSIRKNENSEISTVIFSCGNMNENLAKIRKENIIVELASYNGFKISKNVIHQKVGEDEKIMYGVYTKVFDYIKFKKVQPLHYFEDYVICKISDEQDNRSWLQIGDKIVIAGKNLYDGKKV